jgi:hypothetical protein
MWSGHGTGEFQALWDRHVRGGKGIVTNIAFEELNRRRGLSVSMGPAYIPVNTAKHASMRRRKGRSFSAIIQGLVTEVINSVRYDSEKETNMT